MLATFFIEGKEHERFVYPYIEILTKNKIPFNVYSFDNLDINGVDSENIKQITKKDFLKFCLNLESNFFITTTPGIGNSYFPKSKIRNKSKRPLNIYVFHSLVSPNEVYSKNSFNGFDYVLSPNLIISEQLKFITSKRNNILTIGYPVISNNHYFSYATQESNKILIAPSWGPNSIFHDQKFTDELINSIDNELKITLRPHPMEIELLERFSNYKNISFDFDKELNNLGEYQYLITDWSGIGIEFSAITSNKTIYIVNEKKKRRNLKSKEKHLKLIEIEIRNTCGVLIDKGDLKKLNYLSEKRDDFLIKDTNYLNQVTTPKFDESKFLKILD